ncbi:MAG TPA: carbohydrate binding family 9 domain-containing protein, partial [Thermoanaerobaculia bacterium]
MKSFCLNVLALILGALALSAAPCPTSDCDPSILARRSLAALPLTGPRPVIDGRLDEPVWQQAAVATGFVVSSPRPGAPASLRSEARVLVDSEAIYIGLTYFDPEPAKIQAPLARRDDETVSDWAFVEIDSRHDRRSGFSFGVNPRGVQVDGLWSDDIVYDSSWNAVWEAAAHVDARGWTAEVRIPFSQLAFRLPPGASELVWGINFYRYSPGHGESSNWSPRYHGLGGVVSHFNDLHLPAPPRVRRLEVTPYVAARAGNDGQAGDRQSSV